MPKVTDTRKQRAAELLRRIMRGPALDEPFDGSPMTPEYAADRYQIWARSWIVAELVDLIPELRQRQQVARVVAPAEPVERGALVVFRAPHYFAGRVGRIVWISGDMLGVLLDGRDNPRDMVLAWRDEVEPLPPERGQQ